MVLSLCGMLVTVCSFQLKSKRGLLIWQTAGTCFYLVSYIFSKGGIAVYLNAIYLVRNFLFMSFDGQKGKKLYVATAILCLSYIVAYMGYVFLSGIGTAEKWWNLLPVSGAVFGTIAVTKSNVNGLRAWKTGDSLSWLAFNMHIGLGALGGILGEIFNLVSIAVGLFRFRSGNSKNKEEENDHDKE